MDEEKKDYEPRKENEIMSNDTQGTTRESHLMRCLSQAITYEEKIQEAISVIEGKVSILLLPPSLVLEDDSDEKERVRSPLITELGKLQLKQIESLGRLESLAERLDLCDSE